VASSTLHRILSIARVLIRDEAKASRVACISVSDEPHLGNFSVFLEQGLQVSFFDWYLFWIWIWICLFLCVCVCVCVCVFVEDGW